MKIDFFGGSERQDGFGIVGRSIYRSLEDLGHKITADNPDVCLTYSHPYQFHLHESAYNVGYFVWESTQPQKGWKKHMRGMDELWTTSPWMQTVAKEWGFETYLFEHGIDPLWNPTPRVVEDKMTFLFQGLEALRKGGAEAMKAFRVAFQGVDDVELVIKAQGMKMDMCLPKVRVVCDDLPLPDLIKLYQSSHVFVAPTYGEGYGLPARDAAGTGMPVIATQGFLPYERYLNSDLLVPSSIIESPWQDLHPGNMFQPNFDELVDRLRMVYNDYGRYASQSLAIAPMIHEAYNWNRLTNDAFLALEARMR